MCVLDKVLPKGKRFVPKTAFPHPPHTRRLHVGRTGDKKCSRRKRKPLGHLNGWKRLTTLAQPDGPTHFSSLAGNRANKTKEGFHRQEHQITFFLKFQILLSIAQIRRTQICSHSSFQKKTFMASTVDQDYYRMSYYPSLQRLFLVDTIIKQSQAFRIPKTLFSRFYNQDVSVT